jgi:uncharacterized delta-60 repeat protein
LLIFPATTAGRFLFGGVNPRGSIYNAVTPRLVKPKPALPGQVNPGFAPGAGSSAEPSRWPWIRTATFSPCPDEILVHPFGDGTRDSTVTAPADRFVPGVGGISVVRGRPDGKILVDGWWKDGAVARLLPGGGRRFNGNGLAAAAPERSFTLTPDGLTLAWATGHQLQRATTLSLPDGRDLVNPSPGTVPLGRPASGEVAGRQGTTARPEAGYVVLRSRDEEAGTVADGRLQAPPPMKIISVGFLLSVLLSAMRLAAQPAGSLDTNFVAVAGTDVAPVRLAPLADGRLYVGGQFTNYGGAGKAVVALLRANGQVDPAFTLPPLRQINPAIVLNGQVLLPASTNVGQLSALLALPDGRAVIAGTFTDIGGTPARRMALLAADGTPAVTSFPLDDLEPQAFAVLNGPAGTFYVGNKGNLSSGRLPLLRFKLDGSLDSSFTPPTLTELGYQTANPFILLPGPGQTIYAITAAAVNGAPASDILRLTSSGALDTTFAGTGKANIPFANLSSFVTDGGGRMVFTGVATYRGATLNRKINRLTVGGDVDTTFQATADPGFGGRVVVAQADGKVLYTGGQKPIYRLNADGTADTAYADPGAVPVKQNFLSLTTFVAAPDGGLFAGGFTFSPTFQILNGAYHIFGDPNSAPTIAAEPMAQTNTFGARTRFSVIAQGAAPLTYQWFRNGTAIDGATSASLVLEPTTAADSNAEFHCVVTNGQGSTPTAKARLTLLAATPGGVYRESDAPVGTDATVTALEWDTAGRLLAAGGFTKFHGTNRVRVARLLNEGRLVDPAFEPTGINAVGLIDAVLPLSSGKLLAMGKFNISYEGGQHIGSLRLTETGALDTTFNPNGTGGEGFERFSEAPDGRLFVGGFSWNGTRLSGNYGRLSADGIPDSTFVPSPSFHPLRALISLPDGKVLVTGYTNVENLVLNGSGVLRLNADGTQDPTFYRGQFVDVTRPSAITLLGQPDGKILVAGSFFEKSNGAERVLGVIRLLENGQLDPSFNPVPARSVLNQGSVWGLALQADGRILIRGDFTTVGGFARPGIARLWPNGVVDPEFSPGPPKLGAIVGSVATIAVSSANNVFLGGNFSQFDGVPRTNFVRLNGGPLRPIPAPPTIGSQPTRVVAKAGTAVTLTVEPGGDGPFQYQWRRNQSVGSTNFVDIAGATNASLTFPEVRLTPFQQDSGLYQLAVVNPGGAVFTRYITLLVEPDPVVPGTPDGSFAAQNAIGLLTSQPQLTAPAPEGMLYVSLGRTLVRVFEDGTPDLTFVPPADLAQGQDQGIAAVKRQPDGKILIAGRFKDGALARLLPDGSYDPDFIRTNSYGGFFQSVPWEIGLQSDGKILLAGSFENFAGRPVNGLIRFLPDGTVDPNFSLTAIEAVLSNPVRVLPGTVVSLRVLDDDRIYIGGGFNRVHGAPRVGVARLNADGSLDTTFVPPTNAATPLGQGGSMLFYTLGPVTPDGGVYVFGTFRPTPEGPVDSALRLFPNGLIDGAFHVSTDFQINFGTVQGDGKLIVTGQFTKLNGQNRGGFARLNVDGSTDASFTQGASYGVGAPMSILPDGKLLVGGVRYFTGSGAALPAQEIDFVLKSGGLELTWPAGFQLQRATTLWPPDWQNVGNPSPFTVPLSGPGEFFRVVPAP